MPIGKTDVKPEMTKAELDEVWKKYGKLDKKKKRLKLFKRKNVRART